MSATSGWIGVDFDGTLAHYDGWKGVEHVGAPIPAMVDRVKAWIAAGYEVRVVTARVGVGNSVDEIFYASRAIQRWCQEHIGRPLVVTASKDTRMLELWDDRAVQVEPNTGVVLGRSTRGLS